MLIVQSRVLLRCLQLDRGAHHFVMTVPQATMLMSFRTSSFWIFLTLVGCSSNPGTGAVSNQVGADGGRAPSNSGSAGRMNGPGGAGGSVLGSAPPGPGLGGSGGTAAGNAAFGASGTGGGGSAGTTAFGSGTGGSGNSTSNGGSGGAPSRGPAPTFTLIYNTIITPSCGGTQCHLKRPTPFGYDFSSKSAASNAWRSDVIPGDGAGSPMFQVLNFGLMPKDKPVLSVEQLYMVLDWIDAGALDN